MTKTFNIPKFPKRFFFGAAVSSHQVEGNNHNNWSVWELDNAKSLAHQAEYKLNDLPLWDEIKEQALDPNNYVSGNAIDHFNRYEADLDIAKMMNMNAFRFSIEWSRIEPTEGAWNIEAIDHYRQYIAAMKKRGLEPMMTLFHWTTPVWFSEKGGFEKASNIKYFVRFAEKILHELGPELRYITTINEPDTVVGHGYFLAEHPPQKRSPILGAIVYRNLLKAHKQVYRSARRISRRFKVGYVKSYAYAYQDDGSWKSKLAVFGMNLIDRITFRYVGRLSDFYGVNFYFSDKFKGFKLDNPEEPVNDLGWYMDPGAMEQVIMRVAKRKKPIIITESGVADMHDKHRKWWISHSISAIHRCINRGVDVFGYMHWSLFDNFEWAYGKWARFGLIEIDYKTLKRKPRPSAIWYAKLIKQIRGV